MAISILHVFPCDFTTNGQLAMHVERHKLRKHVVVCFELAPLLRQQVNGLRRRILMRR
jgi:hypothetical protein